jgi:predicted DNA binding CopG/RHH family protein
MQPGMSPDDLHTILSRYHTWAGKQPSNGNGNGNGHKNGNGAEEVREIPYEEAIREYRNRRSARKPRQAAPATAEAATTCQVEPQAMVQAPAPVVQDARVDPAPGVMAEARIITEAALPPMVAVAPAAWVVSPVAARPAGTREAAGRNTRTDTRTDIRTETRTKPTVQERSASAAQKSAVATEPAIQTRPQVGRHVAAAPAKHVPQSKPQTKTHMASTPAKPAVQTQPQTKKPVARSTAPAKKTAAPSVTPRKKAQPAFRQVLVRNVEAKEVRVPKKAAVPDRDRRITTRFSSAEQRRIEKQAAQVGLTVSAYLRQCALSLAGAQAQPENNGGAKAESKRARNRSNSEPATLFSQPTNSLLGNWLTLLRQRFLASPDRFSERA